MSQPVTRREFLGTSGKTAAGVAAGVTMHTMLREARAESANNKYNVALIGCGGMGRRKLQNFLDSGEVNLVALCDVDPNQIEVVMKNPNIAAKLNGAKPALLSDYRKVADDKSIDMVIVATPDHWHCACTMAVLAGGKDVYCEKPATHNVREARKMLEAARKFKKTLQIGTHQRSAAHIQAARDFVRDGKLGKITMTNTYTYGNEAPVGLPPKNDPIPKGLDYNTWLGAAPEREFNWHRFHQSWRWFFDYGSGMVGDWNVHLQDIVMWAMDAMAPVSVTTLGGKYVLEDDRTTPDTMQTIYEFPGFVQTYTMRKASGKPWWFGGYGMDFHGTNGLLHLTREGWEVDPDAKDYQPTPSMNAEEARKPRIEAFKKPGKDSSLDHALNFLEAVRDKKEPIASIEKHYPIVVACHLANVSLKVQRQIFWDKDKELCFRDRELKIEDTEANRYLGREYRKGFELPDVL